MSDMSQKSLIDDLQASLNQAATYFKAAKNADFIRHLDAAAADLGRVKTLVRKTSITLVADQTEYDPPVGIIRVTRCLWARPQLSSRKPWDANYPSVVPDLELIETDTGQKLVLTECVSAADIADVGAECVFYYQAAYLIDADAANTTVPAHDRGLLLLRAQAEACKELALRDIGKPIAVRDGISGQSRNSTPAALSDYLMKSFERQARAVR